MQTSAAQWPHPRPKRRTPRILGDAGRVSMTCSSFGWMLTRTCGKCSGKWANLCCVSFGQLHRPRVAPKKKSRNSIVHINHARDEHAGHQTGWTRNQLFVTKHIGWMRMCSRSEWAAVGDPRVFGGHVNQATSNRAHPQPWLHHHHHPPTPTKLPEGGDLKRRDPNRTSLKIMLWVSSSSFY